MKVTHNLFTSDLIRLTLKDLLVLLFTGKLESGATKITLR